MTNITGSREFQSIPNSRKMFFFVFLKSLTSSGQHRCVQHQHSFRLHGLESSVCVPFTPSRGFSFILILSYEHISILTWAKERANPCNSVQFSIRPNEMVNIVGMSVVGSGQCSCGGRRGWSSNSWDLRLSENSVRGPLAGFCGQRIGCWKEFYGQPETVGKLQKACFCGKIAVHIEGHY